MTTQHPPIAPQHPHIVNSIFSNCVKAGSKYNQEHYNKGVQASSPSTLASNSEEKM
jgi:hypothetical protein